jgi:hypothetical protein
MLAFFAKLAPKLKCTLRQKQDSAPLTVRDIIPKPLIAKLLPLSLIAWEDNVDEPKADAPAETAVLSVEANPDEPVVYVNYCLVTVTPEEVILHFARKNIDDPTKATGVVKLYTNHGHAESVANVIIRTLRLARQSAEVNETALDTLSPDILLKLKAAIEERLARSDNEQGD